MSQTDILTLLHQFSTTDGIKEAQLVGNIAMIGLTDPNAPPPIVKTVPEALKSGILEITDPGDYTNLTFHTNQPVLLRRGQGFIKGGKQDRIIKASQILTGRNRLDVYCIESGRWSASGQSWEPKDIPVPLRRVAAENRDQSTMWSMIQQYIQKAGVTSRTSALGAIYDALGKDFEKFVGNFEWWEHQIGMIVIINGVVSGLELFDGWSTFRGEGMSMLRDSYVPEAIGKTTRTPMTPEDVAHAYRSFITDLELGRRHVDIVTYQNRIIYANVI